MLWIQIHGIWIRIQEFGPTWIRIQGCERNFEKMLKIVSLEKLTLNKHLFLNYKKIIAQEENVKSVGSMNGELLSPFASNLSFFTNSMWIRIHKVAEYVSNLDPDPHSQHWG